MTEQTRPDNTIVGTAAHAEHITAGRHPGVQTALAWLAFSHLPQHLQTLSEPLYVAAWILIDRITKDSAELTSALNKLVEAKDWMVRAGIRSDEGKPGPVPRPATVVDPPARWNDVPRVEEECIKGIGHVGGCGCWREPYPTTPRPIQDRPQA